MNNSVTGDMPQVPQGPRAGHWGLSQEALKGIACITMLIDHIGAVFLPGFTLRIIGRISFPIYCFLLAEGVHHTRNPGRYGARLCLSMVISELAFDLAFFGGPTGLYQSVMVTLLLGFLALQTAKRFRNPVLKILTVIPFALLAELLRTDYGAYGVVLIALFGLSREMPLRRPVQFLGMALLFLQMPSMRIPLGSFYLPIQMFALLAMVPICLYSGRKATGSRISQWGFYLFYPVHLTVLYWIGRL